MEGGNQYKDKDELQPLSIFFEIKIIFIEGKTVKNDR